MMRALLFLGVVGAAIYGFLIVTEAVQGASHTDMFENQRKLADTLRQNPNVESFMSSVAGSSGVSDVPS